MSRREPRLRDGLGPCLLVFAALRVGLWLLSAAGVGLVQPRPGVAVPGWPPPEVAPGWSALFTAFERQDALWFLRIAADGYRVGDGSAAFFPLYPLASRAVSWVLGGRPLAGALVVSHAAFLGALVLLYDLTARELSASAAHRTIVYVAVFPTSFFFLAPYSESLFLLLAVAAFREARLGRWWLASAAGALAALTRGVGVVLAVALVFEALEQRRARGASPWPGLAASAGVLLGPLAYLGWWHLRAGDALAPIHAQASWQREGAFPLTTLLRAVRLAVERAGEAGGGYWILDVLVVGAMVAAVVAGWRRLRSPYLAYAAVSLLVPLAYPFPPRPLLSMPRFAAVVFPTFWVLADAADRRALPHDLVVAASAACLGLLTVLFVNWWFIF